MHYKLLILSIIFLFCIFPTAGAQQLRFGVLKHDTNVLSHRKESGTDANIEWQSSRISLNEAIDRYVSVRGFVGYSGHMAGDSTDEIYGGAMLGAFVHSDYDFNLGLGLATHDGKLDRGHKNRNALGQRVLFYASFELGRWWGHHGLFAFYQHASNGPLSGPNQGINNLGVRYGYRFSLSQ